MKGEVDRIIFALRHTNISNVTGTREEFAKLVEGNAHHSIGGVERFFDTITMMDIDINVEHTRMVST